MVVKSTILLQRTWVWFTASTQVSSPPSVTAVQRDLASSFALCGQLCACGAHTSTYTHTNIHTNTTYRNTHIPERKKVGREEEKERGREGKEEEGNSARCDKMDES